MSSWSVPACFQRSMRASARAGSSRPRSIPASKSKGAIFSACSNAAAADAFEQALKIAPFDFEAGMDLGRLEPARALARMERWKQAGTDQELMALAHVYLW